ncbi:hypothetical protein [Halobacterium litoreum]|uniref:Uncharacterized protein n=1 Tax=Halobacterium litoreum TaxID=2039234 RepID=A0ABD5N7W4_9EURY|nr:hypothetical protein [Halobacterium litoreum]UHH14873.1 hypothetical protein LT972_14800 [Halobacterium litoreum]
MELGAVGSPIDVATFVTILVLFRYETAADLGTLSAGVVALAERDPGVDDARLAADLDVDDREVSAVRATACDGGHSQDGGER